MSDEQYQFEPILFDMTAEEWKESQNVPIPEPQPFNLRVHPDNVDAAKRLLGIEDVDEDFFGDSGQDEAKARLEARRNGAKFGETAKGFQAFTKVNRTAVDMVSDYAEYGDAEKTGGKDPKKGGKQVDHKERCIAYLKKLYPDHSAVVWEEYFKTVMGGPTAGRVYKVDKDGFIDATVRFLDRGEISVQMTTIGSEADHLKKMGDLKNKKGWKNVPGINCDRHLRSGKPLIMVLFDRLPGKVGPRYNWVPVGNKREFCACHYDITLDLLKEGRDKRERLAANKLAKGKKKL